MQEPVTWIHVFINTSSFCYNFWNKLQADYIYFGSHVHSCHLGTNAYTQYFTAVIFNTLSTSFYYNLLLLHLALKMHGHVSVNNLSLYLLRRLLLEEINSFI